MTLELLDAAVSTLGGSPREGQRRMAEAVSAALSQRHHLLVQAGTGTGKSLGYLVPALEHAVKSGRPVIVSTATIALQSQLVSKDLPALIAAAGDKLPRKPSFALLKGRSNFLCLQKLAGGYPDEAPPGTLFSQEVVDPGSGQNERLGDQVRRLREWAEETETGDRDHLDMPVTDRAWRQVSVTGSQCIGTSCPLVNECFSERNRAIAQEVDLVVTNHALLAINAFDELSIVPEHDAVIVDEAHELASRITSAVTLNLHPAALRSAQKVMRSLGVASSELETAADSYALALADLPEGRLSGGVPPRLQDALTLLEAQARRAARDVQEASDDPLLAGARKTARATLQEVTTLCRRVLEERESDVLWVSQSESGSRALYVAPLSIAYAVRDKILASKTLVMTSATLALGGNFEQPARQVGLFSEERRELTQLARSGESADKDCALWAGIDVGSPFAYNKQGILYLARHLPPPGRDGLHPDTLRHLCELISASRGGALCLFSSRRAAEEAADYARGVLDTPVFVQGEDGLNALVSAFRDDPHASLFGTLSLWQGVDVQGDSCRLVVMDRIPFPRPDDPLTSARQERITSQRGNAFMAISASHAALLMAQGAGRLIRSSSDRGMVAVLDSRIATKRYGSYLISAMPPLWRTYDAQAALAALHRLSAGMFAEKD
ncbi:ATP-dependent DNA helicase [Dermabacteraceae bacterium P13088]